MVIESADRDAAVAALEAAIHELVDFEGAVLETALIEECVLPDLRAALRAFERPNSASVLIVRVAAACNVRQRAERAFKSSGFAAVAGVLSNASYRLLELRKSSSWST